MSTLPHSNDTSAFVQSSPDDDKYARLEALLRQIVTLASELAADSASSNQPKDSSTVLQNYTIIRKTSTASEPPLPRRRYSSRSTGSRSKLPFRLSLPAASAADREADNDTNDDSDPESSSVSVQEPFSPGALALSLDAVMENHSNSAGDGGDREDEEEAASMCFLDTPSPIPLSAPTSHISDAPLPLSRFASTTPARTPASLGRPSHHSADAQEEQQQQQQQYSSARRSIPKSKQLPASHWRVCIAPVPQDTRNGEGMLTTTPAFVRLEALLPCHMLANGPAAWNGDGSCVIIGRRFSAADETAAMTTAGVDTESLLPCSEAGAFAHDFPEVQQKSLHDFIDEWECAVAGEELESSSVMGSGL